jgi:hypothetical protein
MQSALRDDALTSTADGIELRVGLPWIRSLPIACLRGLRVEIDGIELPDVRVRLADRVLPEEELRAETGWWYAQDRVVLAVPARIDGEPHDVVVSFRLLIPYLSAGPGGGPLEIPVHLARRLDLDHPRVPSVSLDVA